PEAPIPEPEPLTREPKTREEAFDQLERAEAAAAPEGLAATEPHAPTPTVPPGKRLAMMIHYVNGRPTPCKVLVDDPNAQGV
ncbi:MAG TPA: hypothetical protein VMY35_06125, partial [Phycisphaerae bacterium]|nr:hypothetical protein [Phycisphaerae bacterium]